jgi:biopolymer transport protein ExbD
VKFPRNARIFRGRLDVAPFAAVFFLLAMFLLLGSLVYTPGVSLQLPVAEDLPGTDKPGISVAIDAHGRLYYRNQLVSEAELKVHLSKAVNESHQPLALLVHADKAVTYERLVYLTLMARNAGISSAWLATLPKAVPSPIFSQQQ